LNAEAFTRWKVGALERLAGASGEYRVKSGYGCRDHRTPQAHHRKNPCQEETNMIPQIPETHADLIDEAYCVALTTVMPNGQPQTTPVWCNREGDFVMINTMRGFRKEKNMRINPKVALLAYDPGNPLRNIEIRGTAVEMTENGAMKHLDELTQLYLKKADAKFFGDSVPADLRSTYIPVKVKIVPDRVRVEG
jgi:PPOX class probable F420-dependent enzyme